MTQRSGYASPAAFRRAVTDRLRANAVESKWSLAQLQRQLAYDRFLERLYLLDDGWIVKGAIALLARDLGARATIDVDVYRESATQAAEADLRAAVGADLGDWFHFEIGPGRTIGEGENGVRLPVTAFVGTAPWASFHVDLVGADLRMTGEPEPVPPIAQLTMPDLQQQGYRAYPLADHLADKVVATFQRYGPQQLPSTRFKDLIDLVSIVRGAELDADITRRAVVSEAERRDVSLPTRFLIPDRRLWVPGYAAEARRSFLPRAAALDDALAEVAVCLDPLMDGTAVGTWRPGKGRWEPDPS
ncbi:MAG: nucleotidyl transferase AbiEii/AbiGii toxin family protein [Geodermatophilaceae bacterium]|nr:nucleotidyl transferase AbiEii/AbiGii toxin family protein [Geodermatophilaceae bacterium]